MSQQNIDFGTFPDDPSADPIRSAFAKTQNNFNQLFAATSSAAVTSVNRTAGAGITVNNPTGNVIVSANIANIAVSSPNLLVGTSLVSLSNSTIYTDSTYQTLYIVVPNTFTIGNLVASNANFSGNITASNLGNVSSLNLDGNSGNILYGNGVFAPAPVPPAGYGNSDVATFLANYGSNTITTTGNVSVGNITASNLGNVSSLNLDGNSGNILYGNGVFAPAPVPPAGYGNSNVATFLANYGSNTITTTGNVSVGNIIGNGQALSGLAGANVSGNVPYANFAYHVDVTPVSNNFSYHVVLIPNPGDDHLRLDGSDQLQYNPSSGLLTTVRLDANIVIANLSNSYGYPAANVTGLGNISTVNIDGNSSNVLYGNGVFASAPSGGGYGDSNVASFLSSYGSNTITTTGNITVGSITTGAGTGGNITGANIISANTLSISGNASVGNIIGNGQALTGINGSNVTGQVGYAAIANSVAVGNVSGIGNIATINQDGNSSNILYGNGVFASAPVTYGNSNVATFLASYGSNTITTTGTVSVGNLVTGGGGGGNITGANVISANTISVSGNITGANLIATTYSIKSVVTSISAAGSTQGDATPLSKELNIVSTVSSGQGVILPVAVPGIAIGIVNTSGNTLIVYPNTGGAINNLSANTGYSLNSNTSVQLMSSSTTQWYTLGTSSI